MEVDKDKATKANLQGKLRLKRSISDSSQSTSSSNAKSISSPNTNDQETCYNEQSSHTENVSRSPHAEDSLADFKSPKAKSANRPILSKFKIDSERAKKEILKSKSKSNVKSRKSTSNIKQPSIESSFFKPQTSHQNEIKESVPCPLCLRPFKDDPTCTNHMKTCAAKNKVSVKQLLDAKKLQDRQAEERKAMGLLATPVLPERKKAFRSKKYSTEDDPQLQLVLAMSESLYQAEQMVELEQAALLAGIPSECIKDMNDEERKTTLRNFGFTTNKPATGIATNKTKKKKLLGPTILQTRSKEDKDRVLTERIACILTGDDAFTQAQQKTEIISRDNEPTRLRSKNLKEIEKSSDKLWDKSRLTKKYNDFYVKDLKSHFLPSDQQVETAQSASSQILAINDDAEHNVDLSNVSIEYEPTDIDVIINQETEKDISNLLNLISESENMDREFEFMKILSLKWRNTLNDSAASDLIIFVKNDKHIYVHKLVFHVQCSNILLHIETNNSEKNPHIKEKISWIKYEQLSALAFLEFIYCGSIHQHNNIFENDDLLSEVRQLARLYQVPGLFTYLRSKQKEFKSKRLEQSKSVHSDISNQLKPTEINESISKFNSDPLPFSKNDVSVKKVSDRQITASPDLFESEDERENVYSCKTQENNTNLKILVELIDEDNEENTNDVTSNIQDKNTKNISSQKTVVNLGVITNPQSDISLSYSPTRDIHGTVTPKNRRSPDIHNDITPERMDYDGKQIAEAVTPKVGRSPERFNGLTPKKEHDDNDQIAEAVTPKAGRSSERHHVITTEERSYDNEQIAEAVTPKARRSPETVQNSPLEMNDFINNDISEAKTPEYNTSAKLNDYVTPKKRVYADIDIEDIAPTVASPENDNESMYTALTPPRNNETGCQPEKENIKKLKTDLSLFIDKVRRANAKSALDTDSETDTPILRVTRKNPFLKQRHDDSYGYLRNDGRKNNDQRRVISLLEQDILEGKNKALNETSRDSGSSNALDNTKSHELSTSEFPSMNLSPDVQDDFIEVQKRKNTVYSLTASKDESCSFEIPDKEISKTQVTKNKKESRSSPISDDEMQDITVNESAMSMYSRYKKHNKHNNSIAKYREELNFKNTKEADLRKSSKISKNLIQSPLTSKPNVEIADVTLVSDSDEEEPNNSTLDKKEHINQEDLTSKSQITNADDTKFPLHLVDDNLERLTVSKVASSTAAKDKKSKHSLIDLSVDSDEENINNDITIPHRLAIVSDNSLKNKKLNEKEFSKHIDDEINKILQSSPDFHNQCESMLDKLNKQKNQEKVQEDVIKATFSKNHGQREVINLSPISIISSPELCEMDREELRETNDDSLHKLTNKNFNRSNMLSNKKGDGFDTIDNEYLEDIDFDDNWITKDPSLENNATSKSPKSSSNFSKRPLTSLEKVVSPKSSLKSPKNCMDRTPQMSSLISSPILSQNRRKSRTTDSETTNANVTERRKDHSPKQSSKQTRKLQTKSASATNFSEPTANNSKKYNLQRSSSFVTPERNKNSSQKVGKHAKDMTPPIDYSQLGTPELHKELKKYGLKPQTRSRATMLLTHIYNETHPASMAQKRTSSDNSSDSDDAPPPKRQNSKKTCKKNILKKKINSEVARSSQNCPIIAEEMDYDEADAANSLDNPVSIKDVFTRLLRTNKELYTKVLTYEPLPLESLHLMLKHNGFKCKQNTLMDFLDEQCITFQVQNSKGNRTKKRERKK
ncbi:hypothetical protein TSAR_007400 [Trichomalopsis sarcophagae]|uniref:Structure-specific endonuclease subunit SLX4 n=1 Tax=Trichomalopsis sarcophagae TaxID=543379 RepID=A0A232FM21_9HYME|nr:hypothetical protein TSAR_007400 [Trichomalopsis sarcophagae]